VPTTPRVRRSITHTVPLGTKVVRPPPEMTAYRPSEVTAEPFGREGRTTSSASAGLVSGMRATSAPGSPARAFSRSTIETLLARKLGTTISFPFVPRRIIGADTHPRYLRLHGREPGKVARSATRTGLGKPGR